MTRAPAHIPSTAILMIVGAVACFSVSEAIIKWLASRYPVPLLIWARYTVHCLLMVLVLGPSQRGRLLATGRPALHVLRAGLLLATSLCGLSAFQRLPLAEATAIAFCSPLIVTLLARPLLGERVGPARWVAVLVGFAGVMLVARPGSGLVPDGVLFAFATAVVYALYQILTRKLSSTESPVTLLFHTALIGSTLTTAALPWMNHGPEPALPDYLAMGAMGVLAGCGHFLLTRAFREAPASLLSPLLYVQLLWATLFGWLIFDQLPDQVALGGMLVIGTAGVLIAIDSRRLARAGTA